MRFLLSFLLILVGALLTFPASLAAWEQRELMDRDRFIEMGNNALRTPEVQVALTERLTNQVMASNPPVSREIVRPIIERAVADLPNSALNDTVLAASHRGMVAWVRGDNLSADEDRIYLDFTPVVESLLGNLGLSMTQLRLPPDAARIVLVEKADVVDGFRAVRWFDKSADYLMIAPFVVMALALLIASNRGLALVMIGLAVAGTAALRIALLLGPLRERNVDQALVDTPITPIAIAAAREVYNAYTAGLLQQEALILGLGAALVAVGLVLSVTRKLV